ncbi:type VI secretion system baseplate subunit TssF [Haliangium sp.]|uniref:type VI secretion system baseplate subunit TssF n=1 Tax=Haliangium sp. TaxID=2663208 RepID=UPI003D10494D
MDSNDFYREFLHELESVDAFLVERDDERAQIEPADPDVRRLMEAISFFATRSRQMTVEQFHGAVHRLVRGHLDELLVPQPSRGLIQAVPNDRLVEPAYLPQGSEVRVVAPDDAVGLYTTMHGLLLLPLAIEQAALGLRPGGGFRLRIGLSARLPLGPVPEPIRVHVSYLNDLAASLRFGFCLQQHLERASVNYGDTPEPTAEGAPCELRFGAPAPHDSEAQPHPLGEIRRFFHFPASELFFDVRLPAPERPWRRAWIDLDLDQDWPTEMVVNRDVFRLFVVPIENLRRGAAEPLTCDGTRSRYPIRAPATHADDVLCAVRGVYEETATGARPIPPAHLATGAASYEVETVGTDPATAEHQVLLRLPGSFEAPRQITVDGSWYQPWFDSHAVGPLRVGLQTRHIEGVRWQVKGTLTAHRPSPLWGRPFEQLELLSLKSKPVLTRNELMRLLDLLGAGQSSLFRGMDELIRAVRVREEVSEGAGQGLHYMYEVSVGRFDDRRRAVVFQFLSQLWRLVESWTPAPARMRVGSDDGARDLLIAGPLASGPDRGMQ